MAKRVKQEIEQSKHHCRDCVHSYDWHSKALDGRLILCRCKLDEKSEHGKWCKFLSDVACKHYELISNGEKAPIEQMGSAT